MLTEDEASRELRTLQENFDAIEKEEVREIMAAMQVRKEALFPWGNQTILDAQLEPAGEDSFKLTVTLAVPAGQGSPRRGA
jgi:hypothetical protein